jgi:hypothetical protein
LRLLAVALLAITGLRLLAVATLPIAGLTGLLLAGVLAVALLATLLLAVVRLGLPVVGLARLLAGLLAEARLALTLLGVPTLRVLLRLAALLGIATRWGLSHWFLLDRHVTRGRRSRIEHRNAVRPGMCGERTSRPGSPEKSGLTDSQTGRQMGQKPAGPGTLNGSLPPSFCTPRARK